MFDFLLMFGISIWVKGYNSFVATPISTKEEAQFRGHSIAQKVYPNVDYKKFGVYTFSFRDQNGDEIYCVRYGVPTDKPGCFDVATNDGTPAIDFKKSTGEIVWWK